MTFLMFHLLHTPRAMEKLVAELTASDPGERISSMEGMSDNAYFQACIKESLRFTPSFVMPLPRRVPDEGREIAGEEIPGGTTVSIVNHALHRNKTIFGEDADKYIPERWMDPSKAAELERYLIPFSAGHRSCVGRK
jgi:cytochrome P450